MDWGDACDLVRSPEAKYENVMFVDEQNCEQNRKLFTLSFGINNEIYFDYFARFESASIG